MTALQYFKQPMKYQTFLGGGIFSSFATMKLLSKLGKTKRVGGETRTKNLADNS